MARKPIILQMGATDPDLAARRGDFPQWILNGMGLSPAEASIVNVPGGDPWPVWPDVAGVVVTGSHAMVSHRQAWSERAAAWLAEGVGRQVPVLGICYGHQLLAHALGGQVDYNPRGREIGSVDVTVFDTARDDPLLGPCRPTMVVHVSHAQSVTELPRGACLLAASAGEPHQAFRVGACAWGLQFHPEFDEDIIRHYLASNRNALRLEEQDVDGLLRSVRPQSAGPAILRRFRQIVATGVDG